MTTTPEYDRELIARMLDVCGHPKFTLDAYREQARLLRAADNASASAETVSRKPEARGVVDVTDEMVERGSLALSNALGGNVVCKALRNDVRAILTAALTEARNVR